MSLTLGDGPLGGRRSGAFNFDIDAAPKHRILWQPFPLRVRALVGEDVVLDTRGGHLLFETAIPPQLYAPLDDHALDRFTATSTTTHCPFKGDASYRSLGALEDVLWTYEQPLEPAPWLEGSGALYWDRMDAWFVEEERVVGHLKDPFHRVDVYESTREAVVRVGGEEVARSARPKLVFETSLPVRVYVPPGDVRPGAVATGSGLRTICPHKGEATYWTCNGLEDAAWSYETPLPDALRVQAHFAFDDGQDGVEVELS